ncbi:hypothetical protein MASR1M46_13930 [Bacteroidales bacterium]
MNNNNRKNKNDDSGALLKFGNNISNKACLSRTPASKNKENIGYYYSNYKESM